MNLQQLIFDKSKLQIFLAAILIIVGTFNCYIAYTPGVQGYGIFYWYTTYEYGFLRRGLLGTFFQLLISPFHFKNDPLQVQAVIATTHAVFCMITVFLNAKIFILSSKTSKQTFVPFLICLILSTSFYIKNNANCVGYIDPLSFIFLQIVLLCFIKNNTTYCIILSFIAVFIHQQYLFLYLPFFLYQLFFQFKKFDYKFIIPLVTIFAVTFTGPSSETIKMYTHSGLDQHMILTNIREYLSLETIPTIIHMYKLIYSNFQNFLIGFLYYSLPALCIIILGLTMVKRFTQRVYFVLISFSATSIAFIAWDMWRMQSFSTVSAYVTYLIFLTKKNIINTEKTIFSIYYSYVTKCCAIAMSLFFLLSPATRIYIGGGRVDHLNKYPVYFENMLPFKTAVYVNNAITYNYGAFTNFELTNIGDGFLKEAIPFHVKENTEFKLGTNALAPGKYKTLINIMTDSVPFKCSLYFQVFGKKHIVKKVNIEANKPENIELFFDFSEIDAASAGFVISIDPLQHSYTVNSIRITKQSNT